jgi:hypothetical protein
MTEPAKATPRARRTPVGQPLKPTVIEALSKVMEDVRAVGKDDRNPEFGYQFRGIDAVVNAVGPVLRQHGVIVMPLGGEVTYRDVQTSKGKPSRECTVKWRYRFYGPEGDFIDAEVPGESMDSGDKGTAKAMSVAYRVLLLQSLCIPTGDRDPDGDTYERDNDPDTPASLRARIAQLGGVRGKTNQEIADDFAAWSEGVRITTDDVVLLARYIDDINEGKVLA